MKKHYTKATLRFIECVRDAIMASDQEVVFDIGEFWGND